jgi:nucleoside-diphosphate-sugar epimerase
MTVAADGNYSGKRLVIFGCGYVGAEVARQAGARGMNVTALTRNAAKAAALTADGVDAVVADLSDHSWHPQVKGGADFVLNCVSSGGGGIDGYRRSYVKGMRSVLTWARDRGSAGALVYTGSTSVYPQNGGVHVDETAPAEDAGERAGILLEAERLLCESSGAARRWFVLRLAGIYGPGRHHLLEQVRSGEIAGRGDYHLNLIHRDDICAAIWAAFSAAKNIPSGVFNVADDSAATKRDIVDWLAEQLQLPAPRFTGARAQGRRAGDVPDRIIDNGLVKRQLGWSPRYPSFREGYGAILRAL